MMLLGRYVESTEYRAIVTVHTYIYLCTLQALHVVSKHDNRCCGGDHMKDCTHSAGSQEVKHSKTNRSGQAE